MAMKKILIYSWIPFATMIVAAAFLGSRLSEAAPAPADPAGPTCPEDLLPVAAALGLHSARDGTSPGPAHKICVSERPDINELQTDLTVHAAHFGRWKGTVALYRASFEGCRPMYTSNWDEDHPERYGSWGQLFVYGDPALIARLKAAWEDRPPAH
jgi:hypothetical protein